MANKADDEGELRAQVEALRADVERLSDQLAKSGSAYVNRVAEEVRQAGERALASAEERVEAGRQRGEEQVEAAQSFVRQRPLTAVACALGVGFLLARLTDRD
ncbi:MAG: YqjD family protein [Alphaproteobacteria bacterium]